MRAMASARSAAAAASLRRWAVAGLALLCAPAPVWAQEGGRRSEVDARGEPRIFTLNQDREAAQRAQRLDGHLTAGRFERAFDELERLLADHGGDVLPLTFSQDPPGQRPSLQPRHLGAAAWATAQLERLPPAGLAEYERRFGSAAELALEAALGAGDGAALAALLARWPVARASQRAALALGDLELARGHRGTAAHWWQRAESLALRLGIEGQTPALALRRAALESLPGGQRRSAELRLPGEGETIGELPSGTLERWRIDLPPGPFNGLGARTDFFNVIPVIHGERVYVNTTLELICCDAFSGQELWSSGEPAGWERLGRAARSDFFRGLDYEGLLAAPAAAEGVVVAALQIPFSIHDNEDIEGLTIMRRLPQRRLFAFDARSGRRLWSHECPPDWDGGPLPDFEQEMAVAGPPAIREGLVLVPCVRMEGRVKLHVAAYDLWSGRLVWQTQVVTGQRELNMFNRHEREYSAPPVRIEGERVLVATQLGTLAALDLFTGRILWQALYDQIPLPGTHGYLTVERRRVWRNAPPLVADGLVLCTPIDSEDLIGVELDSGRTRLSVSNELLRPRNSGGRAVDLLLGADSERLWLGGTWLVGWRRPGGLASQTRLVPGQPLHRFEPEELLPGPASSEGPRMLFNGQRLLVPSLDGVDVFDPLDGQLRSAEGLAMGLSDVGNLALGDGLLISASGSHLSGFLDPAVIERRTRERYLAAPQDAGAALALARLLAQRAADRAAAAPSAALALLAELRSVLEPLRGRGEIDQELARGRLAEARLHALQGDAARATLLFSEAADLSLDLPQRLQALLALEENLRYRDPAAWEALLDRLTRECGRLAVPAEHLGEARWLEFAGDADNLGPGPVRVSTWCAVQRALQRERESAFEAAVLAWQALVETPESSGEGLAQRAAARIGRLIELLGRELYAPVEARAEALLASLTGPEAPSAAARGMALEELIRRYPFSKAAESARGLRLDWALESDDPAALARSVSELWPPESEGSWSPRAVELLVDLAIGLGRAGNTSFERAALARAARELPEALCRRAPYQGWRLDDLARALEQNAAPEPEAPRFDQNLALAAIFPGQHAVLGRLRLESGELLYLWRQGRLEAFPEGRPGEARFSQPVSVDGRGLDAGGRALLARTATGGRVVLAGDDGLLALDAASGATAWRFELGERAAAAPSLALAEGLVLVLERPGRGPQRLHALDLASGAPVWVRELPSDGNWIGPTAAGDHALVFDRPFALPARARAVDLFSGRLGSTIELPVGLPPQLPQQAFVQGDLLVVPHFQDGFVGLYDLLSGRLLSRVECGPGCDLFSLVRHGPRCFVVGLPSSFSEAERGGRVAELEFDSGRLRDIERLASSDVPIGLRRGATLQLEQPWLFVVSNPPGARRTPLLALDLASGRRWSAALPVGHATLYDADWTLPAVSQGAVALSYGVRDENSLRRRFVRLEFYELASGRKLDSRMLSDDFPEAREIRLFGSGQNLWISSVTNSGRQDRIDLLERPKEPR